MLNRMCVVVAGIVLLAVASSQASAVDPPVSGVSTASPEAAATSLSRQGMSPFAIALTADGRYAYVGFDLAETIAKVRLSDLAIEAVADLSAYFPIESRYGVLDATETRLFVATATWRKILVLDAQTLETIHVIEDVSVTGMLASRHGPSLLLWDGSNVVRRVNTETYEVTQVSDERIGFLRIRESASDPDTWYVLTQYPDIGWIVGVYHIRSKAWSYFSFAPQAANEGVFDFEVLPDESKAYLGVVGPWYPAEYHAPGWLYSIDLQSGQVHVMAIDGGALCLAPAPDGRYLYVGAGWPIPNSNNLLVVDTRSDAIVGNIPLGRNRYGAPYTQMNDLQISLADPQTLYATSTDGNALLKIRLNDQLLTGLLVFNDARFGPQSFASAPVAPDGYILLRQSARAFVLDTAAATLKGVVRFPAIRPDAYAFDVAFRDPDTLLIFQGESVLEVDASDMRLRASHPLAANVPSIWYAVLARDRSRLYTITQRQPDGRPDTFIALDTTTFQKQAERHLDGGAFNSRPFELPDAAKLYAVGGEDFGAITIHVLRTDTLTVAKTITFDDPQLRGISGGPYFPYAYDPSSHVLYVGATRAILAIDTVNDALQSVIPLRDVAAAIGLEPWQVTYVNAIALVFSAAENYLYVVHFDRSFVSVYDLTQERFLSRVIPLPGFWPQFAFASHGRLYTLNTRSDSVSVINMGTKTLEKTINLHDYLRSIYLPVVYRMRP